MTLIAIENFIDNASDAETFCGAQSLEQVKLLAMYKRTQQLPTLLAQQ